jgi:hypothetical protein
MCIGILPFKPLQIHSRSLPNLLESRSPCCALEGRASPNKFVTTIQVRRPTTQAGTGFDYYVDPRDYSTCALRCKTMWRKATEDQYSDRKPR